MAHWLKTNALVAYGQTWKGHAFYLKKTQLVKSLKVLSFPALAKMVSCGRMRSTLNCIER